MGKVCTFERRKEGTSRFTGEEGHKIWKKVPQKARGDGDFRGINFTEKEVIKLVNLKALIIKIYLNDLYLKEPSTRRIFF